MLIGVDAGGTSTRAVLLDRSGRCLGYGQAGGGNPVSWGPERAAQQIVDAIAAAVRRRSGGVSRGDESVSSGDLGHSVGAGRGVAILAMAGGSAFRVTGAIEAELGSRGFDCEVVVASDLLATFCSGTAELDGYAVVAGTGAAAIRVRGGVVDGSADGLGWLLGDAGSGFWIGRSVVRAALAALDGRGPATALTSLLLAELGIPLDGSVVSGRPAAMQAVVDVLYRGRPVELSRFATLAFQAAGVGGVGDDGSEGSDPVATAILSAARSRLVETLAAVRLGDVAGPVVLGGGIARRLPGLVRAIGSFLDAPPDTSSPPGVVMVPDGTVGAGVLALRHVGHSVGATVFARLTESIAQRRAALRPC